MSRSNILEVTNLTDLKSIVGTCVTVILGFTTPETPSERKIMVRKFLKRKAEQFPLIKFVYMEVSDEDRKTLSILGGSVKDYPKIHHIRDGRNCLIEISNADEESMNDSFKAVEHIYIAERRLFQAALEANKKSGNLEQPNRKSKKYQTNNDMMINDQPTNDQLTNPLDDEDNEGNDTRINQSRDKNSHDDPITHVQLDPMLEKKKILEKLFLLNKKRESIELELLEEITKRKRLEESAEKKRSAKKKVDENKEYRKNLTAKRH